MTMGEKNEKAAKAANTKAMDTADIKKLTKSLDDLSVTVAAINTTVAEMKVTVERTVDDLAFTVGNALTAMDKAGGQAEDAAMACRTVLTDGAHIPGIHETTNYLRQIEAKLTAANLGPSATKMEELMREPIVLMKKMGKESVRIATGADWRAQRIAVATALTVTAIQGVVVVAAKAAGIL